MKAAGGFSISKPDFAFAFGIFHVVANRYLIMLELTRLATHRHVRTTANQCNYTKLFALAHKFLEGTLGKMAPIAFRNKNKRVLLLCI